MTNKQISDVFDEMADILEIKGENFFRVNAYRKGSMIVTALAFDIKEMLEKEPEKLKHIKGIGEGLREKIVEMVQTGVCKEHVELKKGFPEGLLQMLKLRNVGPKKVQLFYSKLKIKDVPGLKLAAEKGKIRRLKGMGEKSERDILAAIDEYTHFHSDRLLLNEALPVAQNLVAHMRKCPEVVRVEYAGSVRRFKETIGDIDILAIVKDPRKSCKKVMDHFVAYDELIKVVNEGDTKSTIFVEPGIDVDLRVVAEKSFGAALHYFTGAKEHNVRIREIAKKRGLKVNEYGIFKGSKYIGGASEEEMFETFGLPYMPPEIRRDDGEFEYAMSHKKMPKFVELKDIRGDMHNHSTYSDGKNSLEEMVLAFIALGYEYFAITDHSSLMPITNGMDKKKIEKQWKELNLLKIKYEKKIKILKGCEVDILPNGELDFGADVLKQLDIVGISAHVAHKLPQVKQSKRLIAAIENPYSMILCHPTGRLINKRAEMEFDMEKIINACVANKVALEINASPSRLDLDYRYIKIAKEKGAKFVISTDSHNTEMIHNMLFGVAEARRGWLTKSDVLNSRSLKEFDSYFERAIL